mmetsp:Transcript_11346/g.15854  ORF Transcript_11346/g.15854 Transcript_11346/m.15854 type:complete len:227 (-) Transcript_11346:95-775(-)|eukprot:CAMPEP_0184478694 /NCGR_PEP_ID=MMETSP0113_2-20130426/657_1 /TAXON_ID=91329 /ORGANISM="Norrisiella sphaerica, Strain BC52" /LENGTH=226 /DNA_ID=CAMNT_0026856581 /DNA_START=122 /DNA_END=802 /DNA_ORIENTATION=-
MPDKRRRSVSTSGSRPRKAEKLENDELVGGETDRIITQPEENNEKQYEIQSSSSSGFEERKRIKKKPLAVSTEMGRQLRPEKKGRNNQQEVASCSGNSDSIATPEKNTLETGGVDDNNSSDPTNPPRKISESKRAISLSSNEDANTGEESKNQSEGEEGGREPGEGEKTQDLLPPDLPPMPPVLLRQQGFYDMATSRRPFTGLQNIAANVARNHHHADLDSPVALG